MARLLLVLLVGACAATSGRVRPGGGSSDVDDIARLYELPEAQAHQRVRELLASRAITLLETNDPHVLQSEPKVTHIISNVLGKERRLLSTAQTWAVLFEPRGPKRTLVRVLRSERVATDGEASSRGPEGAVLDLRVPLVFRRDRELEALVSAELDAQVTVEVTEGDAKPQQVEPLADLPPAQPALQSACGVSEGQLDGLLAPGHLLLLSDAIGANEPLAVMGQLTCVAGVRELPLTIALSIPAEEQPAINTFLASAGTATDRDALLAYPFWNRLWQDGRSSVAMVELLERLRELRHAGQPLTVLAADVNASGSARAAFISSRLLTHRAANPGRAIIALLGNALTTRRLGAEWNASSLPVGARLAAVLPEQTHALDVSFWPGRQWTCRLLEGGHLRCGIWGVLPGPAQASQATTPRLYLRQFSQTSKEGFDGVWFIGELTPSPPAVVSRRIDEAR